MNPKLPEDGTENGSTSAEQPRQKLFIKTFGCQMNEYDSDKLAHILEPGYERVPQPEEADLVLINTCSVRDKPEHKLYSLLGEMLELKALNPAAMIGVGGCVAQQEGESIIKRSKIVDFVFGTHNLSLVPSLISLRKNGSGPQVAIDYRDEWEELPCGFDSSTDGRISVFIAISRGCNKNCTYCIVPTTRGKEVSRDLGEILREVKMAVHRGAREITLLGQTVNSYGLDFKPRLSFAALLEKVSEIENLERIRFFSPHPQEIRADFFDLVERNPKVCRHIHLPLQSGSDRILKLMNRNYRVRRYMEIVNELRRRTPDIAITTDIIIGFPGETDEDFKQTMQLVEEVRYDNSYSFLFSPRPGTVAEAMPDTVPVEEKEERLKILQARQAEIALEKLAEWVGKKAQVLLDGTTHLDPTKLKGRISQNIYVNLTETVPELKPGMLVDVEIVGHGRNTLKGKPLSI